MPVSTLVALRNLRSGVTVLTPNPEESRQYLEFQAKGDPSGGDVQYISEELAASPNCVRAVMHGVLALETDTLSPDIRRAFGQQQDVLRMQHDAAEAAVAQSIDRVENRDLVGETCVGPGERPEKPCEALVATRDRSAQDTAPLCSRHESLATEYIRVEDNSHTPEGKSKGHSWMRVQMTRRQTEKENW